MMVADHAAAADDRGDNNDNILVYMGGVVPQHLKNIITHAIIDKSVREIDDEAFVNCPRLLDVEGHDGVERVGRFTFRHCPMLRRVNLPCVRFIEEEALMIARS